MPSNCGEANVLYALDYILPAVRFAVYAFAVGWLVNAGTMACAVWRRE